jgi:lipid A 3-O-deacylase
VFPPFGRLPAGNCGGTGLRVSPVIQALPVDAMKNICILALLVLAVAGLFAGPAAAVKLEDANTFSFYLENDLFSGTDEHYTNGVKFTWVTRDLVSFAEAGKLPGWIFPVIETLPFINEPGLLHNISFSIGQNMYTPEDTSRHDLIADDRPYAGWTYLSTGFHSKNDRRLDSLEFALGIIGPQSYAENTQRLVHTIKHVDIPNGWDNQLRNEPGLVITGERKYRFFRTGLTEELDIDAITYLGGAMGNVLTCVSTGLDARAGWNIPYDFGTSLIRPAGGTSAPADSHDPRLSENYPFSLYAFASAEGRLVLRDIFLDGNTFTKSHDVEKNLFVADLTTGICLTWYRFMISYAQVTRTREFVGQNGNHHFGSIMISYIY